MLAVLAFLRFVVAAGLSFTRYAGLTLTLIAAGLALVTLPGVHFG